MKKLSAGALVVFMLLFIFTSADLLAAEKAKKDVLAKVGAKEVTKSDIQAYAGLYPEQQQALIKADPRMEEVLLRNLVSIMVVSDVAEEGQSARQPWRRALDFFGRHKAVVVRRDEEDRSGRDLVDDPFGMKPSVSSMNSSGSSLTADGLLRRAAAASSADWRSGSRICERSAIADWPSRTRFSRSALARSRRSCHSSGRRTLRIQRRPCPIPTTLTTHA